MPTSATISTKHCTGPMIPSGQGAAGTRRRQSQTEQESARRQNLKDGNPNNRNVAVRTGAKPRYLLDEQHNAKITAARPISKGSITTSDINRWERNWSGGCNRYCHGLRIRAIETDLHRGDATSNARPVPPDSSHSKLSAKDFHRPYCSGGVDRIHSRRAQGSCQEATTRPYELWDVAQAATVRTLTGHASWVWSVAVAPDGRTALTGSDDRTVRLWDLASGVTIHLLTGHEDGVQCCCIRSQRQDGGFGRQRQDN